MISCIHLSEFFLASLFVVLLPLQVSLSNLRFSGESPRLARVAVGLAAFKFAASFPKSQVKGSPCCKIYIIINGESGSSFGIAIKIFVTQTRLKKFLQNGTNKGKLKQVGKNGILVVEDIKTMDDLFSFLGKMKISFI